MSSTFFIPAVNIMGSGCLDEAMLAIRNYGFRKALIVTDSGLANGTVYHYKIFANDTNGNYAVGLVPTGSPVTPNLTTLANGTEPPNATIAPGGAPTPYLMVLT